MTGLFDFERVSVAGQNGAWRLRDATGTIPPAGITALVGPSGSGKSTLLRCCNRLEVPTAGVVRWRGDDVATLDPLTLRRRVGMVFQRPTPFPGSCAENLRVADPELDDEHAVELLVRVRLDRSFLDREATQLSGGEAQRLCLARSLAARPEVVLMDEVTSSLDAGARIALEELARNLAADGVQIVWVTHDIAQVRRIADEVRVVVGGRVADDDEARAFMQEAGP
ncbi:MAG: UDP-glucose/iron transport system ATP-binding protein [Actinomycetota bacterium]|nr:UDP-glucose/iron transport system ATP-binding protein [Actinomycetota bacterium]